MSQLNHRDDIIKTDSDGFSDAFRTHQRYTRSAEISGHQHRGAVFLPRGSGCEEAGTDQELTVKIALQWKG